MTNAVTKQTAKVKRPAETATPTVFVALTGVLTAFGLDPAKAAAISGLVAAATPSAVTFARNKGWV